MAILDLRDPDTREELGLLNATVSIPSRANSAAPNGRSRAETADLIIDALHQQGPMTRAQIARHLGRRKTPWLIGICEQLVAVDLIRRGFIAGRNGVAVVVYGVES